MRIVLTCVAGVVGLGLVVSLAMAEEAGVAMAEEAGVAMAEEAGVVMAEEAGVAMAEEAGVAMAEEPAVGRTVEPVRFVAPEPISENLVPAGRQTALREPRTLRPIGFAEASDNAVQDVSPAPIAAETDSILAQPDPISLNDTGYAYASSDDWVDCCNDPYCQYCRGSGRAGRRKIGSTCNMGQRHAYFPPMHGYYYFHPYHHSHVRNHQVFARLWGEDPANPYSNRLFQAVYEQYREEAAKELPVVEP